MANLKRVYFGATADDVYSTSVCIGLQKLSDRIKAWAVKVKRTILEKKKVQKNRKRLTRWKKW